LPCHRGGEEALTLLTADNNTGYFGVHHNKTGYFSGVQAQVLRGAGVARRQERVPGQAEAEGLTLRKADNKTPQEVQALPGGGVARRQERVPGQAEAEGLTLRKADNKTPQEVQALPGGGAPRRQ